MIHRADTDFKAADTKKKKNCHQTQEYYEYNNEYFHVVCQLFSSSCVRLYYLFISIWPFRFVSVLCSWLHFQWLNSRALYIYILFVFFSQCGHVPLTIHTIAHCSQKMCLVFFSLSLSIFQFFFNFPFIFLLFGLNAHNKILMIKMSTVFLRSSVSTPTNLSEERARRQLMKKFTNEC